MHEKNLITSWNVNSINVRFPHVCAFIDRFQPDFLCLQELKCENHKFPYAELEKKNLNLYIHGQKSYNGVAIISKTPAYSVKLGLDDNMAEDSQARYIQAEYEKFTLINIYAPNGNPADGEKFIYKITWMQKLLKRLELLIKSNKNIVLLGDFNVIPEEIDCHDPPSWLNDALFKKESRKAYQAILNLGFCDSWRSLYPNEIGYSFWDYQAGAWQKNHGIRIDHILTSPRLTDHIIDCTIHKDERGNEKASDHVPISLSLAL